MKATALRCTLFNFEAALAAEWMIPASILWAHRVEILTLYSAGYTTCDVARLIRQKERERKKTL